MRFGIIGGGNISRTHARAVAEAGSEVVALLARDAEQVRSLADEYGAQCYTDPQQFFDHPSIDAVIVGSPSGLHGEHALAAAKHDVHVLVEKPLEISTRKVDEVITACDRAGVTLGVIFQDRTAPDCVWLKRAIDAGDLGRPILVSARLPWYRDPGYYAASSWRGTWDLDGGGAVMNQGIHTIDLLLWLFGDISRAFALTRTALHAVEVEDTAVACLEFANGAIGTFETATSAYPGSPRRIEVTGTEGSIVIEGDRVVSVGLRRPRPAPGVGNDATDDTSPRSTSPVISDIRGHRRVIEDFIAAVREKRPPLCDGRDARRSVALVEAIYESARTARPVVPNHQVSAAT